MIEDWVLGSGLFGDVPKRATSLPGRSNSQVARAAFWCPAPPRLGPRGALDKAAVVTADAEPAPPMTPSGGPDRPANRAHH
ncbi:hypothetical protein QJS10_CPA01g01686 [Acorus calamus]|uniref:Uncharacterized protein n=1 Tax=Acorus calamus TaxID=4465 RepID=A0AAV9FKE6_ACOCL|nr:hypothetical protein QJS10_CPA01g01686 [Acorus calamus]